MRRRSSGDLIAGKYRLEKPLARGGMGELWTARDLQLDLSVALKLMSAHALGSADLVARFAREAKAAAQLQHPNVVTVREHGVFEGVPFIAMELLEGHDLSARLKARGRLPLAEAVTIVTYVGKALSRAHAKGIVHRDLKPANVFLARQDEDEIVKVLDFGIAKILYGVVGAESTKAGAILGTPYYMAPEQAASAGVRIDPRADLWALGVIAFRMLTGKLPFSGEPPLSVLVRICNERAPRASSLAPDLDARTDAFFERALQRNPAERFQTARELVEAFAALGTRAGGAVVDPRASIPEVAPGAALSGAAADPPLPFVARGAALSGAAAGPSIPGAAPGAALSGVGAGATHAAEAATVFHSPEPPCLAVRPPHEPRRQIETLPLQPLLRGGHILGRVCQSRTLPMGGPFGQVGRRAAPEAPPLGDHGVQPGHAAAPLPVGGPWGQPGRAAAPAPLPMGGPWGQPGHAAAPVLLPMGDHGVQPGRAAAPAPLPVGGPWGQPGWAAVPAASLIELQISLRPGPLPAEDGTRAGFEAPADAGTLTSANTEAAPPSGGGAKRTTAIVAFAVVAAVLVIAVVGWTAFSVMTSPDTSPEAAGSPLPAQSEAPRVTPHVVPGPLRAPPVPPIESMPTPPQPSATPTPSAVVDGKKAPPLPGGSGDGSAKRVPPAPGGPGDGRLPKGAVLRKLDSRVPRF